MKRQPTPEQKAARTAKKAKMRQLAKVIAEMTPEQRQSLIDSQPIVSIEGHCYSPQNQCMIALQMPRATVLGGFQQWIAAGRSVKKGEHGACIWIPIGRGPKGEDSTPSSEPNETSDGERPGFTLGTVFDISQTQSQEEKEAAQAQEEKAADMAEVAMHETPGSSFCAIEIAAELTDTLTNNAKPEPASPFALCA